MKSILLQNWLKRETTLTVKKFHPGNYNPKENKLKNTNATKGSENPLSSSTSDRIMKESANDSDNNLVGVGNDFNLNEEELNKNAPEETMIKLNTKKVIDHNFLQNQYSFSYYKASKQKFSTKNSGSLKKDIKIPDPIEDVSDYSFESSDVELDSPQYKDICETSTGDSPLEETSFNSQSFLHNPLIGKAYFNEGEQLFPELLDANHCFEKNQLIQK